MLSDEYKPIESQSKRITFRKSPSSLDVIIDHSISRKRLNIIGVWLVLWTFSGAIVLVSIFMPFPKETRLMMLIFLAFWAYFEWTVYKAFKWKRAGKEVLTIKGKAIEITTFDGKDNKITVETEKVQSVFLAPDSKFRTAMNDSFWNIGEPAVYLKTGSRNIGFGRQLSREEAEKIEKLIKPFIKA